MELEELRRKCKRFFWCETISDCQDLLDIYIDFLFQAVDIHHDEDVNDYAEADAKILIQMMMTKALHIKNVLDGVSYVSTTGKSLNNIIDSTILASLIRNVYETTGMFNLIYRVTKDKYERQIIYFLWVHAGLSYRQRFDSVLTTEENKEKAEREKKQMDNILIGIENNPIFQKLDEKNQGKIRTKLKERDYLIRFQDDQVEFLSWRELVKTMNIREDKLDHIYGYFSLYSHPSNVSVFQYANMFTKGEESYIKLAIFNMRVAFFMFSIFIADYIKLFPNALKTYESMGIVEQIVINFHNSQARGHEFDINDSWKATG
ncbi:hypothetical protein [Flavobacterium sp.]|jgi:hypothetical protein|uniref:hypothetical protein n=1 Tax=Flavobacterium sp. TaxID=239 RepID=UPI0037BF9914